MPAKHTTKRKAVGRIKLTTVHKRAATGRIRIMSSGTSIVNIMDYSPYIGTGNDDAPYIQQAVNDILSNGNVHGYTLFFPPAFYLIRSRVIVPASINLLGAGKDVSVFNAASGLNDWMLYVSPASVAPIYTPGSRSAMGRMKVGTGKDNWMGRMRVSASIPYPLLTMTIRGLRFQHNASVQSAGGCIYADSIYESLIEDCHFQAPYDASVWLDRTNISTTAGYNRITGTIFYSGNSSSGNGQGVRITNGDYPTLIDGCTFEFNGGSGANPCDVYDTSGGTNKIVNNTFLSGKYGVWAESSPYNHINDNHFSQYTRDCIHLNSAYVTHVQNNRLQMATPDANNTYSHVVIAGTSSKCLIENNTFEAGSSQIRSYVAEKSGSSQNTISGNYFDLSNTPLATALVETVSPTTIVQNNTNYNPIGNVTAPAMPASTVTYTNAFNTDCTVYIIGGTITAITVAGVATGLTTTPATVRVGPNQTIAITYSVAPTWKWWAD